MKEFYSNTIVITQWMERLKDAVQAERIRGVTATEELRRTIDDEHKRILTIATTEAAAEATRRVRAEADTELVKLRRVIDATAMWYEDLLDAARAEKDLCTGK